MKPQFRNIIMFVISILSVSCVDNKNIGVDLQVGDTLPPFQVVMDDGTVVNNAFLKGKNSLIVFFNTSCADCQKELPQIEKFYNTENNATVVCIARQETAETILAFWKENNLTLPFSEQTDKTVYHLFAQTRIPRIYLVNHNLIICKMWDDQNMPTAEEIYNSYINLVN